MKMTETRKEIINLISDYMDKTKSQFGLVTHEKYDGEIQPLEMELDNYTDWFIKECKVIGHYDITAVLKYIDMKGYKFNNSISGIKIHFSEFKDYWISYKPLHLYTEEEDKQLLDLLLKIK